MHIEQHTNNDSLWDMTMHDILIIIEFNDDKQFYPCCRLKLLSLQVKILSKPIIKIQ